jgi:murein L,D-transpeptidase YcbB/YkuD
MHRAAWWVVWIAACTPLATGCSRDDSKPGTKPGCDSIPGRGSTEIRRAADSDAARVRGAADGDRFASLWQAVGIYERIAARGGWPTLSDSASLRVGDTGPVVALLKRRLTATGDLPRSLVDPIPWRRNRKRFDAETEAALRRFQERHGLEPDGILGPRTRAALDVPAAVRAWQLRANLWRAQHAPQLFTL